MDFKKILFKTNTIDVEKALPDGVIFCTKEGKIEWVNDAAAELFRTSKMDLKTSDISNFIENFENLVTNAAMNGKSVIAKQASEEIYYDMTAKEIEDGYVIALRNIPSFNDEINKTLFNKDENGSGTDKNAFLIKLSNDFKAPLQSIVGFAQAMADGLGGSMTEQQEKYIRIIKKNSADLMYFTEKLIELSETECESNPPEIKTFDITNLINSVIRYNEQLCKEKDIRWGFDVEEGMKNTTMTDESLMRKILQNIVEVILRAVEIGEISIKLSIPDNDLLDIKSLPHKNYFMITITSSSLLLSESDLELIFNPYKIIDSPNRKNLLRAITLASVKNMVQSLRGIIWVESRILKNTSFNIILPGEKDVI